MCLDIWDFSGPLVDTYTCNGGQNQQWKMNPDGTIQSAQTAYGAQCIAATQGGSSSQCTNVSTYLRSSTYSKLYCLQVWGKPLSTGQWGLALLNNNNDAANITCGPSCFAQTNLTTSNLRVRDLWAHQDLTVLTGGPSNWTFTSQVGLRAIVPRWCAILTMRESAGGRRRLRKPILVNALLSSLLNHLPVPVAQYSTRAQAVINDCSRNLLQPKKTILPLSRFYTDILVIM